MLQTEKVDKVTIVSLGATKNFDSLIAFRVKSELKGLLTERNVQLLIDFEGVQRIDSAGFGVLISAYILVKNLDGEMKLCNMGPHIYHLFRDLNLYKVFEVYESRQQAVEAFSRQQVRVLSNG